MIITFCGHKELYDEKEVKVWLERVTENLIVNGAETFYLGGYAHLIDWQLLYWRNKKSDILISN